jgi:hypothetical protein
VTTLNEQVARLEGINEEIRNRLNSLDARMNGLDARMNTLNRHYSSDVGYDNASRPVHTGCRLTQNLALSDTKTT